MPIFGRRKNRKTNRTSYSSQRNKFNAGEGTGSNSSGPDKSGNDNYVSPELVRSKESTIKLTPKKVTKVEAPKSEAPKLKKSTQKTTETAAEFRARKAKELQARKDALAKKQKAVSDAKSAETYKPGKQLGKPKGTTKTTGVTSDDKKSQANIAANNERVKKNREAKAAAIKAGKSTYKMVNKAGQTVVGKV